MAHNLVASSRFRTGDAALPRDADAALAIRDLHKRYDRHEAVRGDILGLALWGIAGTVLCAWKFRMA